MPANSTSVPQRAGRVQHPSEIAWEETDYIYFTIFTY